MNSYQNEVTNNEVVLPGRKLDLPAIADAIAMETNGLISKDLYDVLKLAESKGLCAEDKHLPEIILWEDRKLDYNAKYLSKEADCVLMLRTKCRDEEAFNKLLMNKQPILRSLAEKTASKYIKCDAILENEFSFYENRINEAFYTHVMDYPICFHGKVNFSHSNLNYKIYDDVDKKIAISSHYTNFGNCMYKTNRFNKQMESLGVEITNLPYDQYQDLCIKNGYTASTAKKMADANAFANDSKIDPSASKKRGIKDGEDVSLNLTNKGKRANVESIAAYNENGLYIGDTKYKSCNPEENDYELSPFKAFLDECRHDKKHGRDVETFITHETGEFGFDLSNTYAENAPDSPSREETAKLMGYENSYEVKKALKRAREFMQSKLQKLKKENPALYAEIVAGIVV